MAINYFAILGDIMLVSSIRPGKLSDISWICQGLQQAKQDELIYVTPSPFQLIFAIIQKRILVYDMGHCPAGFVAIEYQCPSYVQKFHPDWDAKNTACLDATLVLPAYRGHGLQRILGEAAQSWIKKQHPQTKHLWVTVNIKNKYSRHNTIAQGFDYNATVNGQYIQYDLFAKELA